jgi:hypothetical protein
MWPARSQSSTEKGAKTMAIVPNAGGRGYWHDMGVDGFEPDTTAREAGIKAGLDYTITKMPIWAHNERGHAVGKIPGQFALMSDCQGDPDVIAIVGKEFEPTQNMAIADMLDAAKLTGPGGLYSVDVAGKTVDGRTVFWALKARSEVAICGDAYRDHWLITDGKDGNRALTMALVNIRFLCSNTLQMAVSGASIRVGISHTKNTQAQLGWWLNIAPQLDKAAKLAHENLKALGAKSATAENVTAILEAAYPTPRVRGKAQLFDGLEGLELALDAELDVIRAKDANDTAGERAKLKRLTAGELFESYADDPAERNIAGTLLGVVNAVADCENHRQPTNAREAVAVSNMIGPRYAAQASSIKVALALV